METHSFAKGDDDHFRKFCIAPVTVFTAFNPLEFGGESLVGCKSLAVRACRLLDLRLGNLLEAESSTSVSILCYQAECNRSTKSQRKSFWNDNTKSLFILMVTEVKIGDKFSSVDNNYTSFPLKICYLH